MRMGVITFFCFMIIIIQGCSAEFNPESNPEDVLGAYNEENDYSKGLFRSKRALLIWEKASKTEV